jgi:hypothetical protein
MNRLDSLRKRQEILKTDISRGLDFVIGTLTSKGPSTYGHNLTSKVEGKTVSVYVPMDLVGEIKGQTPGFVLLPNSKARRFIFLC